ncbi:hypothetical protein RRG08_035005 [Elysia crispata]|uniref:Uncharacterized protein n=1 Tax=Elysia crispata TaxID=231223 RepID=A0AAE0ZS37_9GAST|nr:hypothetical protein RRG08_035005 [Elysia crispata]
MRETNLGYALIHSAKAEIRLSEVSAAFWFLLHTSEAKLGQSLQPGSNVDLCFHLTSLIRSFLTLRISYSYLGSVTSKIQNCREKRDEVLPSTRNMAV